jgi:hypothetical protein
MTDKKKSRQENKRKYFNQIYGKRTGRLISEETLQNIPKPEGKQESDKESTYTLSEFSKREFRILANMSEADFKKYMKGVP